MLKLARKLTVLIPFQSSVIRVLGPIEKGIAKGLYVTLRQVSRWSCSHLVELSIPVLSMRVIPKQRQKGKRDLNPKGNEI